MPDSHGFDSILVAGRPALRCSVCGTQGEPWEWPIHRRYQHAQAHAGITVAALRDQQLSQRRQEQQAEPRPSRTETDASSPLRAAAPTRTAPPPSSRAARAHATARAPAGSPSTDDGTAGSRRCERNGLAPIPPEPRPAEVEDGTPEPVALEVLRLARDLCADFRVPPRQFRRRTPRRIAGYYQPESDIVAVNPTSPPG